MRSYGQYCSIARALDVVGDRWTLLIIRELLLRGPCRFSELRNGLPGIAPNLLSGRLKELKAAALVGTDRAPTETRTVRYQLTTVGRALEPILKALGFWGLQFMATEDPPGAVQAQWLAYVPMWFARDATPEVPLEVVQMITGSEEAVIEIAGGQIRSYPGRTASPDAVVEGPPRAVLGLITGVIDVECALEIGLTTHGRGDVLRRLQPIADLRSGSGCACLVP